MTTMSTNPASTTHDVQPDLDAWDGCISDLDTALGEAAAARLALERLHRRLECIEASHTLTIEGGNAETRKARLTVALADDARHQETVSAIDGERSRLLDAERRVTVLRERARRLRAAVALHLPTD